MLPAKRGTTTNTNKKAQKKKKTGERCPNSFPLLFLLSGLGSRLFVVFGRKPFAGFL